MGRILVVDDEEPIRFMLRQMLERAGHEVTTAENGEDAIAAYRQDPTDIIITDLIMPGRKEGIETITELRRECPDVKIFAMSGGGRVGPDSYLMLAEKLGAIRTFCKPFDRDELLGAIDEVLKESAETP